MNYLRLLKNHLNEQEYRMIIRQFSCFSPYFQLSSLCYFHKCLCHMKSHLKVSCYVLFVSCTILSVKYLSDSRSTLKQFSQLTKIPLLVLKENERQLLRFLKFNLAISEKEFLAVKALYNK